MTRRLVALVCALCLFAAACSDDGPDEGQALLAVDGSATVVRADGEQVAVVDDEVTLAEGDRATVDDGEATLSLFGGTEAELRAGSAVELAEGVPTLSAGDLLVVEGDPAVVRVGGARVSVEGAARIAVDGVAAVYAGRATVRGVGDDIAVPALRQVPVAGGEIVPLDYDAADLWDRRFLADTIQFGERLEALARGYTVDLAPGAGRTVDFYVDVIPALREEAEFTADLLDPARPPGETLVGAAIAVQGMRDDFRTRWRDVFSFRDAGAAWGLVALDQGVSSAPLLDTIEVAIGESPLSDDPPPPTTTTTTTTAPPGAPPSTTTTTTAPPQPPPDPEPEPEPGPTDGIVDVLDELLDTLGIGGEGGDGLVELPVDSLLGSGTDDAGS